MIDDRSNFQSWKHFAAGVRAGVSLYALPMTNFILVMKEERQQEPN
jgi:hypothetical protein